ncbi:hypothetical protein [Edaphocola aurantiacus]|uniref:hypothetical protein n=1 Tax=Edaphocola aurantiacus TaxID=2601682 RepID=UPI001C961F85|nr:hypothetical protein [Edaphocola aurantiacus]
MAVSAYLFSMRKMMFLLAGLFLSMQIQAQSIIELEREVRSYNRYPDQRLCEAKLLLSIDSMNDAGHRYMYEHYNSQHKGSGSTYWDQLILDHPNSPLPYMVHAKMHFLDAYDNQHLYPEQLTYLYQALEQYPDNVGVQYELAKLYYKDFLYPIEKDQFAASESIEDIPEMKSIYASAVDSALYYFSKVWQNDTINRYQIYFPIKQIEYFHGTNESSFPLNIDSSGHNDYFPYWYFMSGINYAAGYHNLVFELKLSSHAVSSRTTQLKALKEPGLYTLPVSSGTTVYRFTWLRSFHHPISIRLEQTSNEYIIYWKEGKGPGGYAPKGLKISGRKRLKPAQGQKCIQLINGMQLDSLPNNHETLMFDGASWLLERKTAGGYKAFHTNEPDQKFNDLGRFLLKCTNIRIKEDEIY